MVAPRPYEYYRERSRHFLRLVDDMVDRGEPELVCEVLWGAAAHAIKSVAQRRQWDHGSHALLGSAVGRLIAEAGAPLHLRGQYLIASDLHIGFYGDRIFNSAQIQHAKELIGEFVQTLEELG